MPALVAPSPKNATATRFSPRNWNASAAPTIAGMPPADDRVRAEVPDLDVVEVHRAAVAARAAFDLPVQLGHDRIDVRALGDRVAVRAVRRRDDVLALERRADSGRDRLLPDRDVQEAGKLARAEALFDLLLEPADQQHLAEEAAKLLLRDALAARAGPLLDRRHGPAIMAILGGPPSPARLGVRRASPHTDHVLREPEPERWEPKLADPGLRDLTARDWVAVFRRAVTETISDGMPLVASAVAYSSFFAIPSVLLLVVGLFTLAASPETIVDLMERFDAFMPEEATELLGESLQRLNDRPSTGVALTLVGLVLALWASTSAMSAYMRALNMAYDRTDGRSFVRRRLIALLMVAVIGAAVLILGFLLIFGPHAESFVGDLLGFDGAGFTWAWWSLQWPFLFLGCSPRSASSTTSAPTSSTGAGS